jgi:hypothetical protein
MVRGRLQAGWLPQYVTLDASQHVTVAHLYSTELLILLYVIRPPMTLSLAATL